MKVMTETKVCEPNQHALGAIDGDNDSISCRHCGIKMALLKQVGLTTYIVRLDKVVA